MSTSPVYPNVEEVRMTIRNQWPMGSLRFVSTLIDLSKIVKFILNINNSFYYYPELINNIDNLFKLTKNLDSLSIIISTGYSENIYDQNLNIVSIIPKHVKHLSISISTVDQMQNIVHQLKNLSSVRFQFVNLYYNPSEIYVNWLKREKGYYTYTFKDYYMALWFNNRIN